MPRSRGRPRRLRQRPVQVAGAGGDPERRQGGGQLHAARRDARAREDAAHDEGDLRPQGGRRQGAGVHRRARRRGRHAPDARVVHAGVARRGRGREPVGHPGVRAAFPQPRLRHVCRARRRATRGPLHLRRRARRQGPQGHGARTTRTPRSTTSERSSCGRRSRRSTPRAERSRGRRASRRSRSSRAAPAGRSRPPPGRGRRTDGAP